ncbi:hypothetical protein ACLKA7_010945 [Drosophila subpalustris]
MIDIVGQEVRENLNKILDEAVKYARRTRSPKVKLEHLHYAMQEHGINLDLLHVDYSLPEVEERAEEYGRARPRKRYQRPKRKWGRIIKTMQSLAWSKKRILTPRGVVKPWVKREQVLLMPNRKFPLSKEQQKFYVLITESIMGTSETLRREALRSVNTDSSLQPMLPKLCLFIAEGVRLNVLQHNVSLLFYLLRLVHSLLGNTNIQLNNYLHLLIPPVISCIVAHQICTYPTVQNHWTLREYACSIVAKFVETFNSTENGILTRIINLFKDGLQASSLTTVYGSIIGLQTMGKLPICEFVIPQIAAIADRIEPYFSEERADDNKTPEKTKRAGNRRAATTTKKKNNDVKLVRNEEIIVNRTTVKRSCKKDPLPGQLRIDSFFKSSIKNYKVETVAKASPGKPKHRRTPRKGCKRLFDDESKTTTSCSDVDVKPKTTRKRTQPQRNVKAKCKSPPADVIDLCSDNEPESNEGIACTRQCEARPVILGELEPRQTATLPMVSIPRQSVVEAAADASSKENMPKGRTRKRCPPYKIVEDTTFVVDGFQFGDIPNVTHYFLSHYHADHYVGLTRKFAHPLYMSPITARLVRAFIPIDEQYLHEIDVDQSITLNDIEVTAIEANHCPGAIMLLFKFSTGKCILHTGDFRASFEMESNPIYWNNPYIDVLYLDTTYLSQNYDFCHQSDSIDRLCFLVREFHEKHAGKRILHVCGAYLIGKEKVWLTMAEEFDLRIWTEPHRRKAINCLKWPELQMRLFDNPQEANLHVIGLGKISYPQLDQYFKPFEGQFDMLLAIRPSGWEKNSKPSYGKRISVIGVEYSEHSSYKELERFVRFLKPKNVISTVPVGRDLCKTGKVPSKWYQYKGCGGMLSNGYQPTISSFLETPRRQLPSLASENVDMIMSPIQEDVVVNLDDIECNAAESEENEFKAEAVSPGDADVKPINRLLSDASDDLLSFI